MPGIVVIDQPVKDKVAIWHLSVGDGLESNMAGAWVLPADDDRIDGLLRGRLRVGTDAAAERFGRGADTAGLARAIRAEIAHLDTTFSGHVKSLPSSRRSLVRPRWPRIVMDHRPESAGDPLATGALTLARWISELLTAWERVEKERLARPFLAAASGAQAREFPPGWPDSEADGARA